ncbi:CoA binding domain-containing protein [Diplogelasinospora grovesii]|uniref:CoA binding domain-containing protein n=1 Tax=Diplogelasinospora grovesii TaxID=303347 RepID=A0AAN6N4S0_9PEZI|nr:CoA binding domain-containing protein [Diplogelasinospora grovesii]
MPLLRPSSTFTLRKVANPTSSIASVITPRQLRFKSSTMATDATMRTFFQSPNFAVIGASNNPDKFGYKVFAWYINHSLPVTPINPTSRAITYGQESFPTVSSISALQNPKETSISIITPPSVTRKTLADAKELGIQSVWMQPGSFDEDVLSYARDNFKAVVAGTDGSSKAHDGWCILVDGERGLKGVGKL